LHNICRRCGKEAEAGEIYCQQCRDSVGAVRPVIIWLSAGLFLALIIVLAAIFIWHGQAVTWDLSWARLMGRPVATINGEAIDRQDFRARATANRRILERQYGTDIFAGREGQASLIVLQKELLDGMLEERLIAQEAKRLDIRISNEQVEQELRRIAREIYGSLENFQKRLTQEGMSEEGLLNHIRTILTTRALMKVKFASGDGGMQPEVSFTAWLTQSKKKARIVYYDSVPVAGIPSSSPGCRCGGSASGF
jgi:hypothetical protein